MVDDEATNPGGYLPHDPRHGLTPAQLREYYRTRPPQFSVRLAGTDVHPTVAPPDVAIEFLGSLAECAEPTVFAIVAAPDATTAASVLGAVPERAEVRRFVDSMSETQQQLRIDPDEPLFVCECLDAADGARRRRGIGAAHHAYQASVVEQFLAHGPLFDDHAESMIGSLFLIRAPDRPAAEAFVAADPLARAGVFAQVRVERWAPDPRLTRMPA